METGRTTPATGYKATRHKVGSKQQLGKPKPKTIMNNVYKNKGMKAVQ